MKTLYPIQQLSHDVLLTSLNKHRAALDTSTVGSGKTVKAVEIARSFGNSAFVVCPKIVIPAWKACFAEQGVAFTDVINYEKLRAGNTPHVSKKGKTGFTWNLPAGTLLIFDEVHCCRGIRSVNGAMLAAAKKQGYTCLMLSATASKNPGDMKWTGEVLGLHDGKKFVTWATKNGCTFDPWRRLTFPIKNRHKLEELHHEIYPELGHRISREDIAEFFSETSIITDPLDLGTGDEIQKLYDEMEDELKQIEQMASNDKGASQLTARLRARQAIEMLKVPTFAAMTKDYLDQGMSVAVFLNFSASIDALDERMGGGNLRIQGAKTDMEKLVREESMNAFQRNEAHVILCNITAGGVGINLHDTTGERPRVSLISPHDSAEVIAQVIGRIDRAGAQTDTIQHIIFAAGTVEEEVSKNYRKKLVDLGILHAPLENKKNIKNNLTNKQNDITTSPVTTTDETQAHAKFGPSSLKYFEVCPGYQGRQGTNPAAEMGTRIHEALEKDTLDNLTDDYERLIAEKCIEAKGNIFEHHGIDPATGTHHREIRLTIDVGTTKTFGTCDELVIPDNADWAVQIDWKTGRGAIDDASVNSQAQAYVLGAFQKFPELNTIHFYFVIPQRDEISYATYTRDDMDDMKLRVSTVIHRAEVARQKMSCGDPSVESMLNPQQKVCDYCAMQASCAALTRKVLTIRSKYLNDGFPMPDEIHGSNTNDPEDMAKLLDLVPIIQQWIDGVKARSRQFVFEDGIDIPGYELKTRAGSKSIISAAAAYDAIKDEIPVDEFLSAITDVSFNSVAEIVYDRAAKGKKTAAKNAFEDKLRDLGALKDAPASQFLQKSKS